MPPRKSSKSAISKIEQVRAMQVLDSRGNPTVEVDLLTSSGSSGRAIVPSGASTGIHEALELRDGNPKVYNGKGVLKAIKNVNQKIAPKILRRDCTLQAEIDQIMIRLDGTKNKQNLGANAILGVSMAVARAAAASKGIQLYESLVSRSKYSLPVPMMNLINGGKHAGNDLAIQEFHVEPIGADTFSEALRAGVEVYHALKIVLEDKYGPTSINVGDEGGYAPPLNSTTEALDSMMVAVRNAGYTEAEVRLGIDSASSSFYDTETKEYKIDGKRMSAGELGDFYSELSDSYPLLTIEDPFDEESFSDFANITKKLGKRIKIIGDDIYVTNRVRIERGIKEKATNAILIKLNQIGSVSETLESISLSRDAGFEIVVSHRSGETEDTFISHLATAVGSAFIKAGAPARGERTAKYNELLRIERILSEDGKLGRFAGKSFSK